MMTCKQSTSGWTSVLVALVGMMVGTTARAQWSPADINTLVWYDASDVTTITATNGTFLTQWDDKSGRGWTLSQLYYSSPQTGTRTINGLNVIDFTAANQESIHTASSSVAPSTNLIAIVVAAHDIDGAGKSIILFPDRFGLQVDGVYCGKDKTAKGINVAGNLGFGTTVMGTNITAAVLNWDASAALPGSFIRAFVNGTQIGSDNAYTLPLGASRLGIMSANNPGTTTDGAVAEVIITYSDNSSETREKLEGYLAWKWGLVDKLDASHPYKNVDPRDVPVNTGTMIFGR